MKQSHKYLVLAGTLIALVILFFFVGLPSEGNSQKEPVVSLKKDSLIIKKPVNPSGTFLLYQLL